jgi:multimeric flavodoxin WrbA
MDREAKDMNVVGICGSPHRNGNTAYALRHALQVVEGDGIATTYLSLADYQIGPCDGCFACRNGACVLEDDMRAIVEAIYRCDGLILASPVYMGLVSGQMKVMMDRTVIFRTGGRFQLSGKVGAGIACGGFRNGGQELTLQAMHTFFLQQDMYAVADGPGYSHSGAAIVGRAETDQVGLQTVENLARRLARAVRQMRGE